MSNLVIDFVGEEYVVAPGEVFTAGREGDLVVDSDNPYLHRHMVAFSHEKDFWWIANVGSRLSLTVSGDVGSLQSWLAPGNRVPIVLPHTAVLFTAGQTTYEINVFDAAASFSAIQNPNVDGGELTLGGVTLSQSQRLALVALAENTLRRSGPGASPIPTNAKAAARLGWTAKSFERQVDEICRKFDRAGVKGMRGGPKQLAVNRRARLVEYAVAARVVVPADLEQLSDHRGRKP